MRFYLILSLLIFGLSIGRVHSVSQECESALQSLFAEEVTEEEAGEFLKVQGDITLHRLTWTYLKAQKNDKDSKVLSVEKTILELLNDKYTNADPKFIKAREAFEAQPLSRSTLADIAPYLKEALSHDFAEADQSFKLNASDLKLLSALAKHERSSAQDGIYDHRLLASDSPQSVLNFIKLVNSSYKIHPSMSESELQIDLKLQGLEGVMAGLETKLGKFLNDLKVPTVCSEKEDCTPTTSMSDFFKQNDDIQNIFWESLSEKLDSDDVLLEKLSYGDLWLKVKTNRSLSVTSVKKSQEVKPQVEVPRVTKPEIRTTKPVESKSPRVQATAVKPVSANLPVKNPELKPLHPSVIQDVGLMIEDPLAIIIKDKSGRTKDQFNQSDKKFLSAMAQSILRDEKCFLFEGKIFDRKTGKEITPVEAASFLPPKQKEAAIKAINSAKPETKILLTEALVNGKKSFIDGNTLMGIDGTKLNPSIVIAQELSKKLGLLIDTSSFKDKPYNHILLRAQALKNNQPYFVFENKTYDSFSGSDASTPFRSIAATDAKMNKVRRRMLENLNDKELIRNFHREFPNPDCGFYGVIDKVSAEFKIYKNSGEEVYRSEVLVGAEISDQRTRWMNYNDRIPSSSTGAGIFTIRQQDLSDSFNKKNFNNNILSFVDETKQNTVFAIHQVPLNLSSRYSKFGTSNANDRRISGGCANLKLADFIAAKKWLAPSCKVYVLPEEKGNKFIISDNSLKLVSTAPIPAAKTNLYNYSSLDSKPRPIQIRITNKIGETQVAKEFVKGLEEEKSKLMKLYKLSNDEYNDLALLAYGILGNESSFGKSDRLKYKEYTILGLPIGQVGVVGLRALTGKDEILNTSRGFTQIKNLPSGDFAKVYPEINKDNLINPRNSAVATIAFLAEAAQTMRRIAIENQSDPAKLRITRENMMDFMGYLYQGGARKLKATDPAKQATPEFNAYYRSLQRHMSYVEMTQKIE